MQQDEVIAQALRNASASPAPVEPPAQVGEKVIEAEGMGAVDEGAVTSWVEANGGRAARVEGAVVWVVPEASLDL